MTRLAAYTPPRPRPPARPTCPGCKSWEPECLVPAETFGREGDPVPMCWSCAHLVTHHELEVTPDNLVEAVRMCTCPREVVFPNRSHPPVAEVVRPGVLSAPRSVRVPARERQAQASIAAALTRRRAAGR